MSSTTVNPDLILRCLENYKQTRLREAEQYEKALFEQHSQNLRKKWWQLWKPKTVEESLSQRSWSDLYLDGFRLPEGMAETVEQHCRPIRRLATHAKRAMRELVLTDEHSWVLTWEPKE